MNKPVEGYIPLQQAADLLGVSRPAVYRRLSAELSTDSNADSSVQYADSTLTDSGQPTDSKPASIIRGKKRYVSMAWVLAEQEAAGAGKRTADSGVQYADSTRTVHGQYADSSVQPADSANHPLQARIRELETALQAAQGEANTLRAIATERQAHIDSLTKALDREQHLHLATIQQLRIADGPPATARPQEAPQDGATGEAAGPQDAPAAAPHARRGFMEWVRGWGKKQDGR